MAKLEDLAPDALDQCDGRNEQAQRCQLEADHSGPCRFPTLQAGPVIHCPFDAGHDNGTYGGGWD